jgi:2-keto-4-pentenoate hydratase/2-oxohepta-3-ene-1,7-dioic acid hydratase in catechol pathway
MLEPDWMLVSYRCAEDQAPLVGVLADGVIKTGPDLLPRRPLLDLITAWEDVSARLQAWSPAESTPVVGARLVTPLRYPQKVICAGANYYGHLAEMGIERPDGSGHPYFFFKPPTTTVIGPDDAIRLPARPTRSIDWEAELGVVIGRTARHVSAEDARSYVAGYTIVNDVSARDRLARPDAVAPPFGFDWFSAKAEDTFCPIGPGIVPDWMIADPQSLAIRLSVNGVVKQDSNTSDMVCGIWDLIAGASAVVTLEPGDVIATGTPAGVGLPRGEFLQPGDEVVVEIDQLGRLRNPVV